MLEEAGYEAYNIEGGYRSFLRMMLGRFVENETVMAEKQKDIEKSIIKSSVNLSGANLRRQFGSMNL